VHLSPRTSNVLNN